MIRKVLITIGLLFALAGCQGHWTEFRQIPQVQEIEPDAPPAGDTYSTCVEEPDVPENEFCDSSD